MRTARRTITIGLPACADPSERRFPLTPEGAAMLVEAGFGVTVESGAGSPIHYTDAAYTRAGARVESRTTALLADIVISLPLPGATDVRAMRRGSMLLTLLADGRPAPDSVKALLAQHTVTVALDLIQDAAGATPFADMLHEINGRAAIAMASSLLADAVHGKGILLGGIAGVVPCEVMVLGSGIAACAAARSAVGAGATVRMFDSDLCGLRRATALLGPGVSGSALHPRTIESALRTADIIVATPCRHLQPIGAEAMELTKRGVVVFDLCPDAGRTFPSLPRVSLAEAAPHSPRPERRRCYVNAAGAVPRTAAMALSNGLLTMFADIVSSTTAMTALKMHPGISKGACTFAGRAVNPDFARAAGVAPTDINLYLNLGN